MKSIASAGALYACLVLVACAQDQMKRFVGATVLAVVWVVAAHAADRAGLPDASKTPGVIRQDLSLDQICNTKWGSDPRAVTAQMKSSVFTSYGFTGNDDPRCASPMQRRRCEIDHLVPRSIGGADDVRNLWPEPYYNGTWTATIKDKLEARAHKDVCNPLVSDEDRETLLAKFRRGLMRDWEQLYLQYYPAP